MQILDVETPQAFLKVMGYLKYYYKGPVLFRGQSSAYPTMVPSLFRDVHSKTKMVSSRGAVSTRHTAVARWLRSYNPFVRGVPDEAREPLIQHYGLNTRWIDIVDNPWIALWFACHSMLVRTGDKYDYWTFEKRHLVVEGYGISTGPQFTFVYVLNGGKEVSIADIDGYWETARGARLIDLRRCVPSVYLRPHAQTGWLLTRKTIQEPDDVDFGDFVVGVLRIRLEDALTWLGDGSLLSTKALFPSSHYDSGYAILLDSISSSKMNMMGRISVVES